MVVSPYGSEITADDLVSIKGSTDVWEVDGEPGDYETKRGKGKATIVYLKKAGT
jgi:hypothetical protein